MLIERNSPPIMRFLGELPERLREIINLIEKSPNYDSSSNIRYLASRLSMKIANILSVLYPFKNKIIFSTLKINPYPDLYKETSTLEIYSKSDVCAWIMKAYSINIESESTIDQSLMITFIHVVFERLGLKRKSHFILRELYLRTATVLDKSIQGTNSDNDFSELFVNQNNAVTKIIRSVYGFYSKSLFYLHLSLSRCDKRLCKRNGNFTWMAEITLSDIV